MARAGFVLFDRYPIVKRARTVSHMFDFKEVNFARCDPVKACFDMRISFRKTQSWHVLFQKSDVIQHTPCVLCSKGEPRCVGLFHGMWCRQGAFSSGEVHSRARVEFVFVNQFVACVL